MTPTANRLAQKGRLQEEISNLEQQIRERKQRLAVIAKAEEYEARFRAYLDSLFDELGVEVVPNIESPTHGSFGWSATAMIGAHRIYMAFSSNDRAVGIWSDGRLVRWVDEHPNLYTPELWAEILAFHGWGQP